MIHFHPPDCPIPQNRTRWHAIRRAHQRTDPSPHPKSAARIPQATCYSPGPRRTRHLPADTASPQPSARILPTFPTDHAPTNTATLPGIRQYKPQQQSATPQPHASPALYRVRDVVDAFRRQHQSPLQMTENSQPSKVDRPPKLPRTTAGDRHAIPPLSPSHASVPSPDKLSQHTFQFVDAQCLLRNQFVALVDDELRLGEF